MGAPSDRITAADFVTPPELARWSLAANGAGRIGGVRLELVADATGTRLGACYQQVPLRVLPPFLFGLRRPSLVYLLNPTAGLMDGDAQLVQISAGAGTRALVTGQSATLDAPLSIELIAKTAARSTPHATALVDIGCGAGNFSLKLRALLPRLDVTLIDLSRPMLTRATERLGGGVRAIQCDIR